jgi:hypothetical protein
VSTETLTRRTIAWIERLRSSTNGNPRFRFHFEGAGCADLMSDAAFGYEVGNPGFREGCTVNVSFTPAGRVRFMRAAV